MKQDVEDVEAPNNEKEAPMKRENSESSSNLSVSSSSSHKQGRDPLSGQMPRRKSKSNFGTNSRRVSINIGADFDLDENKDDEDSISTLESDIKSLESISNKVDVAAQTKGTKDIPKPKPQALAKDDEISNISDPNKSSEESHKSDKHLSPGSVSSIPTPSSKKSSASKLKVSPKILLITLIAMSVFSIGFYILIYYSVLPLRLADNASIYNSYYSIGKINRSTQKMNNLKDVSMSRNIQKDVPFFWHIPHAVDISINNIFGHCYQLSQASNYKERIYLESTPLHIIQHRGNQFVNIDLYSPTEIDRAIKVGLANSNLADVCVSPHLHLMSNVFTKEHQGRLFVILSNPIEHLLHIYFTRLKNAGVTVEQDATNRNFTKFTFDNNLSNWLTRTLSNEQSETELTSEHLEIAKNLLRHKFLVGKVDDIKESFNRFSQFFGWKSEIPFCEDQILTSSKYKDYVNDVNEQELNAIRDSNSLDIQLYNYAELLFQYQGSQLFSINKFE